MLTNHNNIPLSVAVWLATDTYDHNPNPYTISATSLLKPIKALVLERSLPISEVADVADQLASKVGTAVHDSIEFAWNNNYKEALKLLGIPQHVIDRIIVNPPSTMEFAPDDIPVYMELRSSREIGKWTISGKFDFVIEAALEDFKTTKVYNWIKQGNAIKYAQQGSIYKWLNPEIITDPQIKINYIFTDWNPIQALQKKDYPPHNIMVQKYDMMSDTDTERFIINILTQIENYTGKQQKEMPACTAEELWQNEPVHKYFKNPNSTARSTKNFDNLADAHTRLAQDGNVGKVVTIPGAVKRCNYCNAQSVCMQAQALKQAGLLK